MKLKYLLLMLGFMWACQSASNGQAVSADDFDKKIKAAGKAQVLDVRSTEEFTGGHLANATNIDWNGDDFEKQVKAQVKTNEPVFVYCLSGGRSARAASKLREMGYKEVYDMQGGMMAWRAANKNVVSGKAAAPSGITLEQFNHKIKNSSKMVLVDFNAVWCGPCKKMAPFLEEISKEKADKVELWKIDADQNADLAKSLGIEALPTLLLYQNNSIIWKNIGFVEKATIEKAIASGK
ncbi:thioredoxin [Flexibacter flexilis DSM 6793]|uniref:Thioredoxin n=1 Tax=Flexibacter flexilis DSM 6793 TaxID=927664 RepID=A0A1I1DMI2_9BACT|nr:thioredoxin [Flexibacter flexilis]SFB76195.1 thioredoxin [Flexibacter flexilis DSM 6793]